MGPVFVEPQDTWFEPGEVKESSQVVTMASARDNSVRLGVLNVGMHACAHDLSL